MSQSGIFKKYSPWRITDFQNEYHKSPTIDIVLVDKQFTYTGEFKYSSDFGKTTNRFKVVTCGDGFYGYSLHTVIIPEDYDGGKIHHTVNDGFDHVFYLEPIEEEEKIDSIETFIKNVPLIWLIDENQPEFEELLNQLSTEVKIEALEKKNIKINVCYIKV